MIFSCLKSKKVKVKDRPKISVSFLYRVYAAVSIIKGNHSSSIQFLFLFLSPSPSPSPSPSFVYSASTETSPFLNSSISKDLITPLEEQANAWPYYSDSASCAAKFRGQVASPVGKLRINAPPKNPATIVIREPRAHRESGELVNSSLRQTRQISSSHV